MQDDKSMTSPARSILITGCSSGIGKSAARQLRGRNWRVFATARKQEDVDSLLAEGFEAFLLDYENEDSIRLTADTVLERTDGKLTALFNNGAYAIPCAVQDLPTEALRSLFEANFFGWHELTRLVLPTMRQNREGRIVQCSSVLGFVALKYRGAYTASKFALEAYSDTLRQELRGTGVHVSLIQPGPIETRFTANALANFHRWVGMERLIASPYRVAYERRIKKMEEGEPGPFKLPASAVVKPLVHAVEARKPKPRYRVTIPTTAMAVARRILPTRALDEFCVWAAGTEE